MRAAHAGHLVRVRVRVRARSRARVGARVRVHPIEVPPRGQG